MAVRYGKRFAVELDEVFPEGAYVIGDVPAVPEYRPSPGGSADARSAAA